MVKRASKAQMPSGEAKVLEFEAVTLRALFAQRDRLVIEVQEEVRKIQDTINVMAEEVAARAKWPRVAPGGGRYEFRPALGGEEMVMRFVPAPKAGEGEGNEGSS